MNLNMNFSRRELLNGGLMLGAGLVLGGCQSAPTGPMADPTWPDQGKAPDLSKPAGRPAWMPNSPISSNTPPVQPNIPSGGAIVPIARGRWTSAQPLSTRETYAMGAVQRITIHHDAIINSDVQGPSDAMRRLNAVRDGHLKRRMIDIGYHYVIDPQGRVWEARPTRLQGGHVHNQNEHNLGIMVMGNFEQQRPTSAALASLDTFVNQQMRTYNVPLARVYTHQEIGQSACPGVNLQAYMVRTRSSGPLARMNGGGWRA